VKAFPYIYSELLGDLLDSPFVETNARTGVEIKMIPGGMAFKIDLTDQTLPVTGTRKLFPHVAAAEVAWFIRGDQTTEFLNAHGVKIWDKFVEADGQTIEAAYGYRWRYQFGRDQLWCAIEALRNNPTDRRIWIQAWDPSSDGLGAPGQKNVPCPVGFTFSIVNGFLHSSLFIRSSDVFVGLPYDVMGHAMLMSVVAASVGAIGLGSMHVTLAHAHLYKNHYEMAEQALAQTVHPSGPRLFAWTQGDVLRDPDGFVWTYRKAAQEVSWPTYSPKPELIL
jgi:thymidylate synthase